MTTKPSHESFAVEARSIAKEIAAEEDRARKQAIAIESRKRAFIERGFAYYATELAALRERAVKYLQTGLDDLAKLGHAPCAPSLDGQDPDRYVAACESHDRACLDHGKAVAAISTRVFRELFALHGIANAAKKECRELGLSSPDGVGFVPEHVRRHARLRGEADAMTNSLDRGVPWAALTADQAQSFIDALTEPEPEPQAPSPTYTAGVRHPEPHDGRWVTQGWGRISRAEDEREAQGLAAQRTGGRA